MWLSSEEEYLGRKISKVWEKVLRIEIMGFLGKVWVWYGEREYMVMC